jgi:hypothetical protein
MYRFPVQARLQLPDYVQPAHGQLLLQNFFHRMSDFVCQQRKLHAFLKPHDTPSRKEVGEEQIFLSNIEDNLCLKELLLKHHTLKRFRVELQPP